MFAINSAHWNNARTRFDLQGASGGKPASTRRSLPGNLCSKDVWPRAKASTSRTITGRRAACVTWRVYVGRSGICALVRVSFDVRSHTTIACKVDRSDSSRGAGEEFAWSQMYAVSALALPPLLFFSSLPFFHSSIKCNHSPSD